MYSKIKSTCELLIQQFETISSERKELLEKITRYIQEKKDTKQSIQLMYVCTHNSRRSHFGQIWAAVAADYFRVQDVTTFSGGTEATAFNENAIHALKEIGFEVIAKDNSLNPKYEVIFGNETKVVTCFSKIYDDKVNPSSNFAAIMTCSDAEENCPFISGVELRIGTTYDDPKAFDGTELQAEKYKERSLQIALETLYVFSKIK